MNIDLERISSIIDIENIKRKTIFFLLLRKRQSRMFMPSWSYYVVNYFSSRALLMCIHPLEENDTILTTLRTLKKCLP